MRVVTLGKRQIIHVGIEVSVAMATTMLRINNVQITWPTRYGIAQIMQRSLGGTQPRRTAPTRGTPAMFVIATTFDDSRLGQILHPRDPFGDISHIRSGQNHDDLLVVGCGFLPNSSANTENIHDKMSVMMLQTPYYLQFVGYIRPTNNQIIGFE